MSRPRGSLALQALYAEISGSNLGQATDYPDLRILWFSSVPPGKCMDSTLN
jgi:hypothetical protein